MSIPPSEANRLSMWEYEAILWNWNDQHSTEVDAPDPEKTMELLALANSDPRLTH